MLKLRRGLSSFRPALPVPQVLRKHKNSSTETINVAEAVTRTAMRIVFSLFDCTLGEDFEVEEAFSVEAGFKFVSLVSRGKNGGDGGTLWA